METWVEDCKKNGVVLKLHHAVMLSVASSLLKFAGDDLKGLEDDQRPKVTQQDEVDGSLQLPGLR